MKEQVARSFRTLRGPGSAELEIKRSRFLGIAQPARDEATVHALLASVRATHPDANHHCFAYRIGQEGGIARFSDDGEPGGTAGRPMMEVLLREELVDVAVVVTRYFGGVLLGSGGLVRAYGQAASEALRAAGFSAMRPNTEMEVRVEYSQFGALEQCLLQAGLAATAAVYTEHVTLLVPVPSGQEPSFATLIADLTAGTGLVTPGQTIYLPE